MTKESAFFILLIEMYAAYKNISGAEVLSIFNKSNLVDYIYKMYGIYHIEALENAFEDLDEKLSEKGIVI